MACVTIHPPAALSAKGAAFFTGGGTSAHASRHTFFTFVAKGLMKSISTVICGCKSIPFNFERPRSSSRRENFTTPSHHDAAPAAALAARPLAPAPAPAPDELDDDGVGGSGGVSGTFPILPQLPLLHLPSSFLPPCVTARPRERDRAYGILLRTFHLFARREKTLLEGVQGRGKREREMEVSR